MQITIKCEADKINEEEVIKSLIEHLKALGFTDEETVDVLRELGEIRKGTIYGHAHLEDIPEMVSQVIDRRQAKSITIMVSREGDDDELYNGHLEIEVLELEG